MNRFLYNGLCSLAILSSVCGYVSCNSTENVTSNVVIDNAQMQDDEKIDCGPGYTELLPEKDWNRCLADTATSITSWKRWWQYLKLKDPVIMNWVDGLKIKIYPSNEMFRAIYVSGRYDPNIISIVKTLLQPGDTFIDVGANSGYVSLMVCKKIGPEGRIVAIEPSSRDYKRLVENIQINNLEPVIKSLQVAVGDRLGVKTMLVASEERSNSNTLGNRFAFHGIEKEKTEVVNVTTIDTIVQSENLSAVKVIKLDIEGSEARALEGAKETVQRFRPIIIIGVNSQAIETSKRSMADIENFFKDNDYVIYDVTNSPFALKKVEKFQDVKSVIAVCVPNGTTVPGLPQPLDIGIMDKIKNFFKC